MSAQRRQFECVDRDDDVYADYSARFDAYNRDGSGSCFKTFSVVLKRDDHIIAGGRGNLFLGALEVRGLWVDADLRGTGIGSELLEVIEGEARQRGASKAMLFTYSWQAEAFYRRHGYSEFGRFDFPEGHYRIDMQKALAP